jgi:hypothetical protein
MAGLDHYPFAVFIHIVGAFGLFAALALEWLAVTQFRRATTASESTTWLRVLPVRPTHRAAVYGTQCRTRSGDGSHELELPGVASRRIATNISAKYNVK